MFFITSGVSIATGAAAGCGLLTFTFCYLAAATNCFTDSIEDTSESCETCLTQADSDAANSNTMAVRSSPSTVAHDNESVVVTFQPGRSPEVVKGARSSHSNAKLEPDHNQSAASIHDHPGVLGFSPSCMLHPLTKMSSAPRATNQFTTQGLLLTTADISPMTSKTSSAGN